LRKSLDQERNFTLLVCTTKDFFFTYNKYTWKIFWTFC